MDFCSTIFCCGNKSIKETDYASWMSSLPLAAQLLPLNNLAIPGSHDTGTYAITNKSKVAPDLSPTLSKLVDYFGILAKDIIALWSKTQNFDIFDQLKAGIRYLDFRVAVDESASDRAMYLVHGLFSVQVNEVLQQIITYLRQYPKEVVLLDVNHFYSLNSDDHKKLKTVLINVFGDLILPITTVSGKIPNLQYMWAMKKQIIIFYNDSFNPSTEPFWYSSQIPSLWPNTTDTQTMIDYNESRYQTARSNVNDFLVCQGILTEDTNTIIEHPFSGLSYLADQATPAFIKWIQQKQAGLTNGVNVFIVDFIDKYPYVETVVNLNNTFGDDDD